MPEKGDSLTRIRGWYCHGCYCFLYDVSSFYETPGDQPGGGKAYSIEKGTSTLYIKSKTRSGTGERVAYLTMHLK
jgi:hypothetical protein